MEKDVDRAMRGMKLLQEILFNRLFTQFKAWCNAKDLEIPHNVACLNEAMINDDDI